ncbi:sushi, von Willebrand factor type A, EGF and pentraxin domain-containing protein 1-like [Uloborus diversus]|uniref:sushi, von Willebrand factor type A, EGF and pentraxin domain-containing protein 1-like n=1 Tax=Uloborus diversus TaxID=327109 RepID=UPI00240981F0|nr:sushi, von Willebrand factor type A, EGF and pentraxin domain-containing protein 1-like [Uloborus diversus]
MCTLLKSIDHISYVGEYTHTDRALNMAENILKQGRTYSNKLIILITDGRSNGHNSPIPIAQRLKARGVIIFSVGVANVNTEEINMIATSPNHIYILRNFLYIKEVNKKLIEDTFEVAWDQVTDSLCDKKCDENANCFCGTRGGAYQCVCKEGYYGNGYQGDCYKCQKGTYKDSTGNTKCTSCPQHSTTYGEGSTSVNDCKCVTGYEKNGTLCSPVKCAVLHAPEGGILIPANCNNTYGSRCEFQCKKGYCPYSCSQNGPLFQMNERNAFSLKPRTCLETGKWSGEDFYCEQIRCPALDHPLHGKHNCSKSNFGLGTVCHFSCEKGYKLFGSNTRTCLRSDVWSGDLALCNEIHCDPLKTNAVLKVKPGACGEKTMPYKSICQYHCISGYKLVSKLGNETNGTNECLADGFWSNEKNKISCKDNERPRIRCPKAVQVNTKQGKDRATVTWPKPVVTDNVYVNAIEIIQPKGLKENQPHAFPIGETKVVYEAIDESNLSSTCSFTVTVEDIEPPKILYCPSDIEISTETNDKIPVNWTEPVFEDNSRKIQTILSNKQSGDEFAWTPKPQFIEYVASDPSGNTAVCSFSVKVKSYPCPYYAPPANGFLKCDTWLGGRLCGIHCQDGYEFAGGSNVHTLYQCSHTSTGSKIGAWGPVPGSGASRRSFRVPWPDCARIQSLGFDVSFEMDYEVETCTEAIIREMKQKFIDTLMPIERKFRGMFCPKDKGCKPENVNITCGSSSARTKRQQLPNTNLPQNPNGQISMKTFWGPKPSSRKRRSTSPPVLAISFNIKIDSDPTQAAKPLKEEEIKKIILENANSILQTVEETVSENVKNVYHIPTVSKPKTLFDISLVCSSGQVRNNTICLNCPPGTFKDDLENTCRDCAVATYQDKERQLSCLPCPKGHTTFLTKSTSIEDCRAPCSPGYHSDTTFEPCVACPLDTYQEYSGRKTCTRCPDRKQTWKVGANSSLDCVFPCKTGSFSETGFEPCTLCDVGSYQDKKQQKECIICPNEMSTENLGTEDSSGCIEINYCKQKHLCAPLSKCSSTRTGYKCICPEGLRGTYCEVNIDDCASKPCLNNGTCTDAVGGYICSCPIGWTGKQCEENINDCIINPCQNGGSCKDLIDDYVCACELGFIGENCEININDCESNPCLNSGICFDMQNDYRCCCTKNYKGKNCEIKVDFCEDISCFNEGTCISEDEGFTCLCESGFQGKLCEENIDDCSNHTCFNNGTCLDGIDSATCVCPEMYAGMHCENALFPEFALKYEERLTSNYVELENSRLLYAITVSFYMRTDFKDPKSKATPVSYSYKNSDGVVIDNALTFLDTNRLILYIHGEPYHTEYSANRDSMWHHYALTWERENGRWFFYVDGKLIIEGNDQSNDKYMRPGIFILGQEQDSLGSTFSVLEAFVGEITEFNVWDYALSGKEIKKISSSCGFVGNVIQWFEALKHIHGSITVSKDVDMCQKLGTCSEDSCHCFYGNETLGNSCKFPIGACEIDSCKNDQECITEDEYGFCSCSKEFTGRKCEYDVDECLDSNGGCSHTCVNDYGSYHCTCPGGMLLAADGHHCKDDSFCQDDKYRYLDGEKWTSSCQTCSCNRGKIACEEISCKPNTCEPEEHLTDLPGECCSKCVSWSLCLASSNNTVATFNSNVFDLEGNCTYTLVEDCIKGSFKVEFETVGDKFTQINLTVYHNCHSVRILKSGSVLVDDEAVSLPFSSDTILIKSKTSSIEIFTDSHLHVQWHSYGEVLIAVPVEHSRSLCGLCGNIENYMSNSRKYRLPFHFASGGRNCFALTKISEKNSSPQSSSLFSAVLSFILSFMSTYMFFKQL